MPTISSHQSQLKCRQCGSALVQVDQVTERIENYSSDVTTTRYKCTNQQCQDDIDKSTLVRLKNQKEQEEAKARRLLANSKRPASQ